MGFIQGSWQVLRFKKLARDARNRQKQPGVHKTRRKMTRSLIRTKGDFD